MKKKYVYTFQEGKGSMRELLGGKGANLAEMTNLGMPVPEGFVITTEACTKYYDDGEIIADEVRDEILTNIKRLEKATGKILGDVNNPLLVSVRSGSRASMPGMMDTVLNLGLNDEVTAIFAKKTGNSRFAYDSYRRFIQMYSDVVMEIEKSYFEKLIDEMKEKKGVVLDTELDVDDFKQLVLQFKEKYKEKIGEEFPADPIVQLFSAIKAVFRSWNNPRAIYYRRINDIPSHWGTAVNIQSMVFGNLGGNSGTGVAFTRSPATGEPKLYGEFLMNAQGEDVVAGIRTPMPIEQLNKTNPKIYEEFHNIAYTLERHYKDMQDMEFTIEQGKLYMLQTRNGKRTATAALKIACDMVDEGMIDQKEAVSMIEPRQLDSLLHPQFDIKALNASKPIGSALPASPGAATGQVVFTADDATRWAKDGADVILVRLETSPEDIEGMHFSKGILTGRGGMTSHAAVVARGMGICCVSGCSEMIIDEEAKKFSLGNRTFQEGDFISLDGSTGNIYGEKISTSDASISGYFNRLMIWADEYRVLRVRANADTAYDAAKAKRFGSEGIGLCRTEHMFFDADRISAMREMIVSNSSEQRKSALAKLLSMQRKDFEEIYEAMGDLPVTIRYLDPPLHEFLPTDLEDIKDLAKEMGMGAADLKAIINSLREFNPMMGHRGCRLAVSYPEISEMQTKAVIEAAINVQRKHPEWNIVPEIMIPLVGDEKELAYVRNTVTEVADAIIAQSGIKMRYQIGTMVEIPRACLVADAIAKEADFFSFGTNDLTQMTFGFSRDDAGSFLDSYYEKKIYDSDPFSRLDEKGVGRLIEMAVTLGKKEKPDLKFGICGEHGGDPSTINFCHNVGLNYVSCSPFRIPIARLAAAQAAINFER